LAKSYTLIYIYQGKNSLKFKIMGKKIILLLLVAASIINCKNNDCENECLNGGTCRSGLCECATGFVGEDCSEEQTPEAITVVALELLAYPANAPGGFSWDVAGRPDIYLVVKQGSTTLLTTAYQEDAGPEAFFLLDLRVMDVLTPIEIQVWDYDDFLSPDYIAGVQGSIWRRGQAFPQVFPISCAGCVVAFKATVLYEF